MADQVSHAMSCICIIMQEQINPQWGERMYVTNVKLMVNYEHGGQKTDSKFSNTP